MVCVSTWPEWHTGFKIWQVPSLAKWTKIKISQYHWTICINHKSFGWYNLWNKNYLSFKCGTIIQWSLRRTHMLWANNDLILQAKQLMEHFKNIPKPEQSKKYVFGAKCIKKVVFVMLFIARVPCDIRWAQGQLPSWSYDWVQFIS